MEKSRTQHSLLNSKISLVYYVLILVATFLSRKVFIDDLGSEILGLNTTVSNLLGLLNLSELGIGFAVSFALYKPLFDDDRKSINEIVSVQGWLYKNIAIIVSVGGVIMMAFFPWIFAKSSLPLWYAYSTFSVLLFSSLLGYFVNYKQIILTADQKQYKVVYITKTLIFIKLISQIIVIRYSSWGYKGWLVLEFIFSILIAWGLDRIVRKNYPWLKTSFRLGKAVHKAHSVIITKTKQLFFHQMSAYILFQTSPLVIYAYTDLTLVAIFGNYMLISSGIVSLLEAVFSGIVPGVGNLIAEGRREAILKVFNEYFACRMFVAGIVSYCLWTGGNGFVSMWVGEEFVLAPIPFALIVLITFINTTRVASSFTMAYGLFKDIWAPITEACLNLGLSVLLGYYYGLTGILSGVLISLIVIIIFWKPYFLHSQGLKISVKPYFLKYILYLFVLFGSMWITRLFLPAINFSKENGRVFSWLLEMLKHFGTYSLLVYIILFSFDKGMRDLTGRLLRMIRR